MTTDLDETPLDPAQLRLQARIRRLILVSGGILGLGILALVIAIVYRIAMVPTAPAAPAPGAVIRATASILPAGARLVGTNGDSTRIVLTYEANGGTIVITVDPRNLAVTGRLDLKQE